jgi:hypothetical protein
MDFQLEVSRRLKPRGVFPPCAEATGLPNLGGLRDLVDSPKGIGYGAWRYRKTNICQRCQLEAVGADCGIEGVVNSQKYWVGCLGGTLATLNNR